MISPSIRGRMHPEDELLALTDSFEETNDYYYRQEWIDGLPIVPPIIQRVEEMLNWTDREPDEVLGKVPPMWGLATVRKIAINAVMAGCLPAHLPAVIAATEAILDTRFKLYGVQATTNPVAPLIVVNGPIRHELEFNSGFNCFGQGNRSNATVGRFVHPQPTTRAIALKDGTPVRSVREFRRR